LPIENYAPTAVVISFCKKTLYFNADKGLVIKLVMNTCA
jgi:hypothetical protein